RRENARPGRQRGPAVIAIAEGVCEIQDDTLKQSGLRSARFAKTSQLWADEWNPTWLETPSGVPPLQAVDALARRALSRRAVEADPFFLDALKFDEYVGAGQALAVRCVELSPPGSTLLASLPTGAGKSAVGLYSALRPNANGTTVVVVPTVS